MNVCMAAYTNYRPDARIKSYVRTLENQGAAVDVIALREPDPGARETLRNGEIFYLCDKYRGSSSVKYILSYLSFFILLFFKLSALHLKKRYTTVHIHNMPNFLVFAALIPKLMGARLILDVHDIMTANYMVKFAVSKGHWLIRILRLEQRISAAFVDKVICADHMQKEALIDYGIAADKVTVIMNVPNEETFKRLPRKKGESGTFNLIYHGTIAKRLGLDILVRAIALVRDEIPVKMHIYGGGDYLDQVVELSDSLGLSLSIHFSKSFFPVEQIPEIVSTMDAGVIPNRKNVATDNYMMPVKLMEYIYLQIPVIVPRLRVIRHYLDDTMVKFYTPEDVAGLAAAIIELYRNPAQAASLVEKAKTFSKKHNWQGQVATYLDLVE